MNGFALTTETVETIYSPGSVTLRGGNCEAVVTPAGLIGCSFSGKELLAQGLRLELLRPFAAGEEELAREAVAIGYDRCRRRADQFACDRESGMAILHQMIEVAEYEFEAELSLNISMPEAGVVHIDCAVVLPEMWRAVPRLALSMACCGTLVRAFCGGEIMPEINGVIDFVPTGVLTLDCGDGAWRSFRMNGVRRCVLQRDCGDENKFYIYFDMYDSTGARAGSPGLGGVPPGRYVLDLRLAADGTC